MQRLTKMARAALVAAALAGCQAEQATGPVALSTPIPILRHQAGFDAAFGVEGVWLVNSDQELAEVGSAALSALAVDFDAESLIVVALGEQPTAGPEVSITGVSMQGDRLYVQGVATRAVSEAASAAVLTYPYAAAVVPRCHPAVVHPEIQ